LREYASGDENNEDVFMQTSIVAQAACHLKWDQNPAPAKFIRQ
jgi:hypothetical protein